MEFLAILKIVLIKVAVLLLLMRVYNFKKNNFAVT